MPGPSTISALTDIDREQASPRPCPDDAAASGSPECIAASAPPRRALTDLTLTPDDCGDLSAIGISSTVSHPSLPAVTDLVRALARQAAREAFASALPGKAAMPVVEQTHSAPARLRASKR